MLAATTWLEHGMFWCTLAVALVTIAATVINYWIFRSQIDPCVIVYVRHDDTRPSLITLVIQNIGKGLAKDVTFSLSRRIPKTAFGLEIAENPAPTEVMDDGPLIKGIPSLGPGDSRVLVWGQYGGLKSALGSELVYVTCSCRNTSGGAVEPVECVLEVNSFTGTSMEEQVAYRQWRELEKIAKSLGQLSKMRG